MEAKVIILIVDDNINFVDRMIGLLEDVSEVDKIHIASNFDAGKNLFNEKQPDMVLLDINLPGKNGIELLRTIKEQKNDCDVIMITNHADEYYRGQCFELGASHFLDKSNDFALVPSLIKKRFASK